MDVHGVEVDTAELMDWWWMSNAYRSSRYDRMLWSAEQYAAEHGEVSRVQGYLALDRLVGRASWRGRA